MSISDDPAMMREILTDHIQYPRNKRAGDGSYTSVHMASSSCIDDIHIQVKMENDVIKDICWHGTGCSISCASCSVMTNLLKGKTAEQALRLADEFDKLMKTVPCDTDSLEEAVAFSGVPREPARINCASIGWKGVRQVLDGEAKK